MLINGKGPLGAWQSKNWDPAVGSTGFDEFCEALSKPIGGAMHIAALPIGHEDRLLSVWDDHKIDFSVLNYAKWIREVRAVSIRLFLEMERTSDLTHRIIRTKCSPALNLT